MVILGMALNYVLFTELPEIIPFSFGKDVVNQGEFAQLTCVVSKGDKPLTITWSLKGDIINSDPTLSTTMLGTQASMLVITSVDYSHVGVYTCRAENPAGVTSHSAELKVNGNLWDGTELFSLQKCLRLFHFHLEKMLSIKETLLS